MTRVLIAKPTTETPTPTEIPPNVGYPNPPEGPLQVLFMGTGTSTSLPIAPCLSCVEPQTPAVQAFLSSRSKTDKPEKGAYNPQGPWPTNVACGSCRSAVDRSVPQGWKNRRGNPGLVLRRKGPEGRWRNVVVDVGKTFREQSCKLFPQWGIKTIDAVIITHGHADAYFGLDDLREWCQRQGKPIPIYLNRSTYKTIAASFPYLVEKTKASGGGDIPSLAWMIVNDESEFEVEGIHVTTLPVHHGRYFDTPPKSPTTPIIASAPSVLPPPQLIARPYICLGFVFDQSIVYLSDVSSIPDRTWDRMIRTLQTGIDARKRICRGEDKTGQGHRPRILSDPVAPSENTLALAKSIEAIDVLERPDTQSIKDVMKNIKLSNKGIETVNPSTSEVTAATTPRPPVLIIDTLWPIKHHASHISLGQAFGIALKLKPEITYFLGMTHPTTHYQWEEIGLSVRGLDGRRCGNAAKISNEGSNYDNREDEVVDNGLVKALPHPDRKLAAELVKQFWESDDVKPVAKELKEWGGRIEPAWDGLGIEVDVHLCGEDDGEANEDEGDDDEKKLENKLKNELTVEEDGQEVGKARWRMLPEGEGSVMGWPI